MRELRIAPREHFSAPLINPMKKLILLFLCGLCYAQQPNYSRMLSGVNKQVGVTYPFQAQDVTQFTTFTNAAPIAATLSAPSSIAFPAGSVLAMKNIGPGLLTITCVGCTIDGAFTLQMPAGAGLDLYSDGFNYISQGGTGGAVLLSTPNVWTAIQTYSNDIRFNPVGGPNLFVNRSISTSLNAPLNGCSWCLGPSDPVAYGCVSCDVTETLTGFTSSNGLFNMNALKPNGSSGPLKIGDYLGVQLGFNKRAGAQAIGSGIAGNSDLTGELTITASTTSAPYVWVNAPGTPGAYAIHPEVFLQAQFDLAGARCWPAYTGVTSFTITCSGAVTGTVSYSSKFRN